MPDVDMQRTNIYLSAEDRRLVQTIKDANGLRSTSSVVRFALRRAARQAEAEERRRRPPAPRP